MPVTDQQQLRSEKLREFITHRPGRLVRLGIPLFFFLLVVLLTGTYFIRYPDTVRATASVNSLNPPRPLQAGNSGRLVRLFIPDNTPVLQGDIIGFIESTANHSEVLQLEKLLDSIEILAQLNRLEEIPECWNNSATGFTELGELQPAHLVFMQGFIVFKEHLNSGFYLVKKRMLNRDMSVARQLYQTMLQQKGLYQQDLTLATKNFTAHDTLHRQGVLSDLDIRLQQSQLISKRMTIPQIDAALITNQGQQNALQKEMVELDNQVIKEKHFFLEVLSAYRSLVAEWIQKYVLRAPFGGTLCYAGFLQERQLLKTGQLIGYLKDSSSSYYAEMRISQYGFGKIKQGQAVWLSFAAYPYQEFGRVRGYIEYIQHIPSDSGYLAKVSLPDGLSTNYKMNLVFTEGLTAEAAIITEERRLSERLFGKIQDRIR